MIPRGPQRRKAPKAEMHVTRNAAELLSHAAAREAWSSAQLSLEATPLLSSTKLISPLVCCAENFQGATIFIFIMASSALLAQTPSGVCR